MKSICEEAERIKKEWVNIGFKYFLNTTSEEIVKDIIKKAIKNK